MTYYRRSKRRPSQYRFLYELKPTALALVLAVFLDKILDVPCFLSILSKAQQACRAPMPAYIWWGLVATAIYGIGACLYRYYRDFHLGEYWKDLEDDRP
jgi:hypothetical protein